MYPLKDPCEGSQEGVVVAVHLQSLPSFYATKGRSLAPFFICDALTFTDPQL